MITQKQHHLPWKCLQYPFSWNELHFGGSTKPVQIRKHEFIVCPEIVLAQSGILAVSKYNAEKNQWTSTEIEFSDGTLTQTIKGVQVHHFVTDSISYDRQTRILYLLDKTGTIWSVDLAESKIKRYEVFAHRVPLKPGDIHFQVVQHRLISISKRPFRRCIMDFDTLDIMVHDEFQDSIIHSNNEFDIIRLTNNCQGLILLYM